jgi:hypothetical protein
VREWRYSSSFLTLAVYGGERVASLSDLFDLGERASGIHWTGGWIRLSSGLDVMDKKEISCPCRKLKPMTLSLYRLPSPYFILYNLVCKLQLKLVLFGCETEASMGLSPMLESIALWLYLRHTYRLYSYMWHIWRLWCCPCSAFTWITATYNFFIFILRLMTAVRIEPGILWALY